jgi:hypothetical protein
MELWFERATELQTGPGTTACISCHTVVPYLLARPVLRKAMGVHEPAAIEVKLLKQMMQRVETYPQHQPLSDAKHGGERSTEAVLNALVLARYYARDPHGEAGAHTAKAFEQLWETQRADGGWDWMNFGAEPDESADAEYNGVALAALAAGTAPGPAGGDNTKDYLDKLRGYLRSKYAGQNLYRRACVLLASTRLEGLLDRAQGDSLIGELRREQNRDGGWSLYKLGPWRWSKPTAPFAPPGSPDITKLECSDGYATGLVSYTLRQAGLATDDPVLVKARRWLEANQKEIRVGEWKCWRTLSLNHDREQGGAHGGPWKQMLMSDAATAFAVLALSE